MAEDNNDRKEAGQDSGAAGNDGGKQDKSARAPQRRPIPPHLTSLGLGLR